MVLPQLAHGPSVNSIEEAGVSDTLGRRCWDYRVGDILRLAGLVGQRDGDCAKEGDSKGIGRPCQVAGEEADLFKPPDQHLQPQDDFGAAALQPLIDPSQGP